MPKLKFPYYRYTTDPAKDPLGRPSFPRPIIPVRLRGPSGYIDTHALVDSGSDETIFDYELADAVGIQWAQGPSHEIVGVDGGRLKVSFQAATYEIAGHRFSTSLGFAGLPYFKALLGQSGFFERAIATFDQGNNCVEIRF